MRTPASLFAVLLVVQSAAPTDVESEARMLEARLIAPCCFTQQVSVHHSPAADEVRRDIRQRLQAGQTDDEIIQSYVERYGKRILAEPPNAGAGRLLYVIPPLVLLMTAALLWLVVRRLTSSAQPPDRLAAAGATGNRSEYAAKLDEQLRELD